MTLYMQLFLYLGVSISAENYLKCYSMVVVSSLPLCWNRREGQQSCVYSLNVVYVEKSKLHGRLV